MSLYWSYMRLSSMYSLQIWSHFLLTFQFYTIYPIYPPQFLSVPLKVHFQSLICLLSFISLLSLSAYTVSLSPSLLHQDFPRSSMWVKSVLKWCGTCLLRIWSMQWRVSASQWCIEPLNWLSFVKSLKMRFWGSGPISTISKYTLTLKTVWKSLAVPHTDVLDFLLFSLV